MIVIPMAGISRRFAEAGYIQPKYMLQAGGESLFFHSVMSFEEYFDAHKFLFIYLDVSDTDTFVKAEVMKLGLKHAEFVCLNEGTMGQADTVYQGLKSIDVRCDESITIFNIDTIRPGFRFPDDEIMKSDGYLEVFRGTGDNWSFVLPSIDRPGRVSRTTEKDPISPLCSTGLYYFRTWNLYKEIFEDAVANNLRVKGEYYIAPLYNGIIARGGEVHYHEIELNEVVFSGIPSEYEYLRSKMDLK